MERHVYIALSVGEKQEIIAKLSYGSWVQLPARSITRRYNTSLIYQIWTQAMLNSYERWWNKLDRIAACC